MGGREVDHLVEHLLEVCAGSRASAPAGGSRWGEKHVRLGGPGTPDVPELAVCEIAAALALSQPAATSLVADCLDLARRLPATLAAVRNGSLPLARARMIARGTRELEQKQAAVVDQRLTGARLTAAGWEPLAARVTTGRLKVLVEQAATVARGPEESAERVERARRGLCVEVVGDRDGVADVYARLGVEDAARLHARLDEVAGWMARLGDDRPHRVLRAVAVGYLADPAMLQALADLVVATPPVEVGAGVQGEGPGQRAADDGPGHGTGLDDLPGQRAGLDDRPVQRAGLGDEPTHASAEGENGAAPDDARARTLAELARRLAGARSTVLYVHLDAGSRTCTEEQLGTLTQDVLREILDHSQVRVRPVLDLAAELTYTGYVAPPLLLEQRTLLNAGACTFPRCSRRARAGDVDHQVPYPRRGAASLIRTDEGAAGTTGSTTSSNTHLLCRRHHRAKTHAGWTVTSPTPGTWLWRSPAGAHYLVTAGTTSALNGVHDTPTRIRSRAGPDPGSYDLLDTG